MISPSTADPAGSSLLAAVQWIEGVALGTIATSIALIAVASVGLLMLSGRLPIQRGARVIVGCFILFGAPSIAAGILEAVQRNAEVEPPIARVAPPPIRVAKPAPGYDPYAGAAVPPR